MQLVMASAVAVFFSENTKNRQQRADETETILKKKVSRKRSCAGAIPRAAFYCIINIQRYNVFS